MFFIFKHTVKPLKTATPRGMKKWPSYRGGRLKGWPSWEVLL